MRQFLVPVAAALSLSLALTACDGNQTPQTTAPNLFSIEEDYVDPSVINLDIRQPGNFQITRMTIARDDTDDGVDNYTLLRTITTAPFTLVYTDTIPASGTYTYRVTAYNAAGQTITTTQQVTQKVLSPLLSLTGTLVEPGGPFAYPMTTAAWTGGAGTVTLETAPLTGTPSSAITTAPLAATGTFTLDLTKTPSAAQKVTATPRNLLGGTPLNCTGDAASSNPSVGMTLAQLRVTASKSGIAAPFLWLEPMTVGAVKNAKLSYSGLVYVDQAVKFTGSLTCKRSNADDVVVNMPLHLYRGWNKVTAQTVTNSSGQITSITWSFDFPETADQTAPQWVLLPQSIQVTP